MERRKDMRNPSVFVTLFVDAEVNKSEVIRIIIAFAMFAVCVRGITCIPQNQMSSRARNKERENSSGIIDLKALPKSLA